MSSSNDLSECDDVTELVQASLMAPDASVGTMLACVSRRLNAFGCGLWEVSQHADPVATPPKGRLLTVAAWWSSGELFALDDVPLDNSPTSRVAISQTPAICPDIQSEAGGAKRDHPFWREHDIRSMCAVPVRYLDKSLGALNVYRRTSDPAFTAMDMARLARMGAIIPGLYRAIRDRIMLHMDEAIEARLREADKDARLWDTEGREPDYKAVFADVCQEVSQAFDTFETSLFVEDAQTAPHRRFVCLATTQPALGRLRDYSLPKDADRLTGWVLQNRRHLLVSDLGNFERDREELQKTYPGIGDRHKGSDKERARSLLALPSTRDVPPLSLLVVPIFGGHDREGRDKVRAALRCYMARSGPYYFSEREAGQLAVVAAQLGQWWDGWRARRAIYTENKAWTKLVLQLGKLNVFVTDELARSSPDVGAVLREALRLTAEAIPGAVLNGVRLRDRDSNELYFAEFTPQAAAALRRLGLAVDKLRRPEIRPDSDVAGVQVCLTGKSHLMKDVHRDEHYHEIFPEVRRMLIVPIGVGQNNSGVLDLRWTTDPLPVFALQAAELIGHQLGIFLALADLVIRQRTAAEEARQRQQRDANANEDFAHQLRSPIAQAAIRMDQLLRSVDAPDLSRKIAVVRGLLRRAERVAIHMRQLADLAYGKDFRPSREPLSIDKTVRTMIQLADDAQALYEPRSIRFHVARETFNALTIGRIHAEENLIEQMVSNLVDNAGKYSFPDTRVVIEAGVSGSGLHYLAVSNEGIGFAKGEIGPSRERHWRSPRAKMIALEGRGIGLWLVERIMKAHEGELQIESPPAEKRTEVRLAFRPGPPASL